MVETLNQCQNRSAYRFTWPGKKEDYICDAHAPLLLGVARAIGLHLQLIPVLPDNQCCQKLKTPKTKRPNLQEMLEWLLHPTCTNTEGNVWLNFKDQKMAEAIAETLREYDDSMQR